MKRIILLSALLMSMTVGFAKDIKTLVVTTIPQMHCENCENKIKGNLRFEKGVKKIETSIPDQTVTIEYDADKTGAEKLIDAFKKFGYEAQPVALDKKEEKCEEPASGSCNKCP
ncbi:MAG: heavy-metal-associated domain-containing protein [Muribaculaceae bacterium]|nr:heavy-metal-associated domain-containing protein [Muribaculaceae bacterium]